MCNNGHTGRDLYLCHFVGETDLPKLDLLFLPDFPPKACLLLLLPQSRGVMSMIIARPKFALFAGDGEVRVLAGRAEVEQRRRTVACHDVS
jgi:hypothetical protein